MPLNGSAIAALLAQIWAFELGAHSMVVRGVGLMAARSGGKRAMSSMTFTATLPHPSATLRPVPVLMVPCAFTNSNVFGPLGPALSKAGFFVA